MTREASIMFFKNYVTNGQQCFRRRMSLQSRRFYKARDVIVISTEKKKAFLSQHALCVKDFVQNKIRRDSRVSLVLLV